MAAAGNPSRKSINILEAFNDTELLKRYRINRKGIMIIVMLVRDGHFTNKQKQPNNTSDQGSNN